MFELLNTLIALPPSGGGEGGGGLLNLIIPFALVFGIMYFLVIRPQAKRQKEQQSFLSSLKTGDKVVTQGGVFGKITGVTDQIITVEISDRVRVKVLRSAVVSRQETALAEEAGAKKDDKKADKKADETTDKKK